MSDLAAAQAAFAKALMAPGSVPAGIAPGRVPSARRMDVYRNNVMHSLVEALGAAFPAVRRLVGDEFFRAAARVFLKENLPSRGTLIGFGKGFPEFLEGFPPVQDLAYLPDVARLELLYLEAYHAADAVPLDPQRLAALSEADMPKLVFRAHPAVRFLPTVHAALAIWRANRSAEPADPADLASGARAVLIARPHFDVQLQEVAADEGAFLNALLGGKPLGEAAESAPPPDLAEALHRALSAGIFMDAECAPD